MSIVIQAYDFASVAFKGLFSGTNVYVLVVGVSQFVLSSEYDFYCRCLKCMFKLNWLGFPQTGRCLRCAGYSPHESRTSAKQCKC